MGCFYSVGRLEVRDGIEVPGVVSGSTKIRNYGHAAGRNCLARLPLGKSIRSADEKCVMGLSARHCDRSHETELSCGWTIVSGAFPVGRFFEAGWLELHDGIEVLGAPFGSVNVRTC